MQNWMGDVLAQWSVEVVYEAKSRNHIILPGYNCVFRREQLARWDNVVKSSRFVNKLNINKPDLDLAQIGLKYFREWFR